MSVHLRTQRVLLESAARTATYNSPTVFKESVLSSARFYLNVTAASGTGGLQLLIKAVDPLSGASVQINASQTGITATGLYVFDFALSCAAPGLSNQQATSRQLPYQWTFSVVAGDGSSYTYSLSMETGS